MVLKILADFFFLAQPFFEQPLGFVDFLFALLLEVLKRLPLLLCDVVLHFFLVQHDYVLTHVVGLLVLHNNLLPLGLPLRLQLGDQLKEVLRVLFFLDHLLDLALDAPGLSDGVRLQQAIAAQNRIDLV